jgi:nucleotide sugar dehydrogenase
MSSIEVSTCPQGEAFPLPLQADYEREGQRLRALAAEQRGMGREIVVVMGVGFVGAIMAGVVADSVNRRTGRASKFVIAMQRPSPRSYWKIPYLNRGIAPVQAEDPEVVPLIRRTALEKKTLTATFTYEALELADVVVVDVQCDYVKDKLGDMRVGRADIAALEESFKIIGERIRPDCLVLIETTVPPGTTERIAYPILQKAFAARGLRGGDGAGRAAGSEQGAASASSPQPAVIDSPEPLLAHSYERVMPGRNYVSSVRDFWRVCSGVNPEARRRVVRFLSDVLNVEEYPLTVLDRPIESETAKIVENSYRATILAFMDEWSRFAERHGVDIMKVIQAIKVRPTHDNIMFPGPGIGGYCLPKDGALGQWGIRHLLGDEELSFPVTTAAININDARGVHAAELVCDALAAVGRPVAGARVLICGCSYREDVGDTRYSGSELVARRLAELAAEIRVHDPYVDHWHELENQDTYPAAGQSRARFFRNQEPVTKVRVENDLLKALAGVDAVVFAVRHSAYLRLDPDWLVARVAEGPESEIGASEPQSLRGQPGQGDQRSAISGQQAVPHPALAVVDCFGILSDAKIARYLSLGCEVRCLGRGHVERIKDGLRNGG